MKCGLCGKEFKDDDFDKYAVHMKECIDNHRIKYKTDYLKKVNLEL